MIYVKIVLVLSALLPMVAFAAEPDQDSVFAAKATLDFSGDVGQSFGTLFEVRDASGRTVLGAGFPDVFNTCVRTDRYALQFYVCPTQEVPPVKELLPRSTEIAHTSVQDLDGKLYAYTYWHDKVVRRWDQAAGQWVDDPLLDKERSNFGDGFMRVAGKLLVYQDGQAWYDGQLILGKPQAGTYGTFYYAQGHLFFYHHGGAGDTAFTRIHACPWKPGDGPIDVAQAVVFTTPVKSETTFAWGQFRDQVISFSNYGGTYVFARGQWRTLREPSPGVSYQVYSTVNYHGDLYLGQYPTGRLLKYDGYCITELPDFPPVMPGVATYSREAQSTMLYRGDLYAGVWPWAELWRLDHGTGQWLLASRMFTRPPVTDKVGHPYEAEMNAHNEAKGTQLAYNTWGQRVCSLGVWQDSLMVATSAKGPEKRDPNLAFLTDEVYAEYGRVWRYRLPGHLSAPVEYRATPTVIQCVLRKDRLQVWQDDQLRGETLLDRKLVADFKPADITWGRGLYGRNSLTLADRKVTPRLH